MKNLSCILEISFVIIGAIIGAGFASGKEISIFFAKYGINGLIGIILTVFIINIVIYRIIVISKKYEIRSFSDLLRIKKVKHQRIINICMNIFLLLSFSVMVAGFKGYALQIASKQANVMTILFIFICYITLNKKAEGIINGNKYLVPPLIIAIFIISLTFIAKEYPYEVIENQYVGNSIISSILYSGYNLVMIIPVIVSLAERMKDKREINKMSIITTCIMIILFLLIFIPLIIDKTGAMGYEFPILSITKSMGKCYSILYSVVIIIAIFTSVISSGYAFLSNVSKENYKELSIIICAIALIVSNFGFGNLIENLYPIFGTIGMIFSLFLAI